MKEINITRYIPDNGQVKCSDPQYISNRYIYCTPTSYYIMAGDKPIIRLAEKRVIFGTLRIFYKNKPLDECEHITMYYVPGEVRWEIKDKSFENTINISVVVSSDAPGFAVKADGVGMFGFEYGGITEYEYPEGLNASKDWSLSISNYDSALTGIVFDESWFANNKSFQGEDETECVLFSDDTERKIYVKSDMRAEARSQKVSGEFKEYLSVCTETVSNAEKAFFCGKRQSVQLSEDFNVETPDPYINIASSVASGEMHGAWRGNKTMHGNMEWSSPWLGWLAHVGHFAMGYHDRAKETLKSYVSAQIKESDKIGYEMTDCGTRPSQNSRFYGKGYIAEDQFYYNMQSQFFHQMILAWKYSGDYEFGCILRDALRLHIQWQDDCFDPDGTGLYMSTINTYPTDSVSYSDAGAVEETCYAYSARCAMAQLTSGEESEKYHKAAQHIKKAFMEKLWIKEKGYPALYADRDGFRHENPWLYASFLPVECGILDEFETAQALYFPLWHMERGENGGFWFSDWTPGIWSVRENAGGENMQQACAFFKGGYVNQGLELLKNNSRSYFDGIIPGDMMHPTIETASLYLKTVVEGLFGYYPDYPAGEVLIYPKLPYEWNEAKINTKDFSMMAGRNKIKIKLAKRADITVKIRVYGKEVREVSGSDTWELEPTFGGRILVAKFKDTDTCELSVKVESECDFEEDTHCSGLPEYEIINPQCVTPQSYGEHMAFRKKADGTIVKVLLHMGEDREKAIIRQKQLVDIPANASFEKINIDNYMNADVSEIFKYKYLSPRPKKGCPVQIGYDGFSYWTFPFWQETPPEMILEKTGTVITQSAIPFNISDKDYNIAFVSKWDNFPNKIEFDIEKKAEIISLLVCGSTSPVFCGVENARLIFEYEDGIKETLPIVNPENYISLTAYPEGVSNRKRKIKRNDVFNPIDRHLMDNFTSEIVNIGKNIRAMCIKWKLRDDKILKNVILSATTRDIVIGVMGITVI